jgi:hypothetical protein
MRGRIITLAGQLEEFDIMLLCKVTSIPCADTKYGVQHGVSMFLGSLLIQFVHHTRNEESQLAINNAARPHMFELEIAQATALVAVQGILGQPHEIGIQGSENQAPLQPNRCVTKCS